MTFKDDSALLCAFFITTVILLLAAFWVPVDVSLRPYYYDANLFSYFAPRALLGTIAKLLHLKWTGFILLRQLFQALWLFLIVFQLTKSLRSEGRPGSSLLEISVMSFLFGFNTVVFTTNGLSEFIDVVPYALDLCTVPLLLPSDGRATITRRVATTLLLLSAVMIHEKSVFDIAILAVWTSWKYGFKRSATLMLPSALGALCFLWFVSTNATLGLSPLDSIELLRSGLTFLFRESFNVWGIILAGGVLWVIFLVCARYFLMTKVNYSGRGFIVLIMMTLLCFSPLLVAHDTIRMVGLIWLPTFLLIREIDLKSALESIHFRQWALGACFLQFLLPPLLIYLGGAAPFNCYSRALILRFLPAENEVVHSPTSHYGLRPAVGTFGLYALDRPDISGSIVCWPPRLLRRPGSTR